MKGRLREGWSASAAAQARVVGRLRDRGHSLKEIQSATSEGRLAYGFIEAMFPEEGKGRSLQEASEATGLEPALIERFWTSLGLPGQALENLSEEDVQALRYAASVLASGLPLVAFLQLGRVYGQALAQIADAEVRLFHMYVHEPLIREGVPGLQMAEEMVLVSGAVVERVAESKLLAFDVVGAVKLKGFDQPVELCRPTSPE